MDFDDFQWTELCEALGLHGDVRAFEVVEAVKALMLERDELHESVADITRQQPKRKQKKAKAVTA